MTTQSMWRPSPGTVGDLEAWIEFGPAHYCMGKAIACRSCDAGHTGDHGRGSVDMRWYLRGHDAAVQFVVYTGWYHPLDPMGQRFGSNTQGGSITPADVGFHSTRPWYDSDYWYTNDDCHLLKGTCYYDGSGLAADEGWRLLTSEGDAAVWAWLHGHFVEWVDERRRFES